MTRTVLILLILISAVCSHAQTDILLTNYDRVPAYYNPGASGSTDYLRVALAGRLQWVGVDGAPKSFVLSSDMPVALRDNRLGAGINVSIDKAGLFSNTAISAQAAWNMPIGKTQLGIGLSAGYAGTRFKGSKSTLPEGGNDNTTPTTLTDMRGNAVDFSAGAWFSTRNFYAGVAFIHILSPRIELKASQQASETAANYEIQLPRTFNFMVGGNIALKNTLFELQPSCIVLTDFSTFTAEATLRGVYRKFLRAGIGYRWKESIGVMLGAEIKGFFFGYAYDIALSKIARAGSGSHELILAYHLKLNLSGRNKHRQSSIRLL